MKKKKKIGRKTKKLQRDEMTTTTQTTTAKRRGKGKSGYDATRDGENTRLQQDAARGKGAWDCEKYEEIRPEDEAKVFEEIATANEGDFCSKVSVIAVKTASFFVVTLFNAPGIPCVQPRKDFEHLAFFFDGCRYRMKADVKEKCRDVKRRLWEKGCGKGEWMTTGRRKKVESWEDLTLLYSCEIIPENSTLEDFGVPPGCKVLIALEKAIIESGKPDASDPYWN